MFRQFVNPTPKGPAARKAALGNPEEFFLYAEFVEDALSGEAVSLSLAVTDGTSAWIAKVEGDAFEKLIAGCRIASGFREVFVEQTRKAFAEPTVDSAPATTLYGIEAQFSAARDVVNLKWKMKETGLSQIIGQASLHPAANQTLVISRILSSILTHNRIMESECSTLAHRIEETASATTKLKELVEMPGVRESLIERCTEVLNDAKAKNTALGATSKRFDDTWETLATQSVAMED